MTLLEDIALERYPKEDNDELISRGDYTEALRTAFTRGATLNHDQLEQATIRAYAERTFDRPWDELPDGARRLAAHIVKDVIRAMRTATTM